jgi:hypothetical protein
MSSITARPNVVQEGVPPNSELPIAEGTTPGTHEAQAQAERPNKYKYDVFAGYSGERYLDTLVQQILPYALARTWRYSVEFQAPGLPCYVGTARLASRVKPQQRKIEMDLQEFRERGLVRMYADRLPIVQDDGFIKHQAVIVKDWTPLYDLAYEYHVWTLSPHYIPAERDYIDLLLAEPELLQKLLRFDNYRRLIVNKKPGRKPQGLTYQCTLPTDAEPPAAGQGRTLVPDPKDYINGSVNISSPYRESNNSQVLTDEMTNSTFPKEGGVGAAPPTIRKEQLSTISKLERRTNEESELSKSKSSNTTPPPVQDIPPESAEEAEMYNIEELKKNPLALAAALADMVEKEKQAAQQQAQAQAGRKKRQEERPRRLVPEWFIQRVVQDSQQLGDNPKSLQSVLTRLSKVYLTAEQVFTGVTQAEVINRMNEARRKAEQRAKERVANGHKKYMQYLIECFINGWEFREEERAFIDSNEPLYEDSYIGDFVDRLLRQYERSGSPLEFGAWVKQRRDQEQQKKKRTNR